MVSRRGFLKTSAALAALSVLPAGMVTGCSKREKAIGVQLYSVREDLQKDFDGTMKALAVAAEARNDIMPDIPTTAEAGFESVMFKKYRGILTTQNMPDEYVAILAEAFKGVSESAYFKEKYIVPNGLTPDYKGPEDFAKVIDETWVEVAEALGK